MRVQFITLFFIAFISLLSSKVSAKDSASVRDTSIIESENPDSLQMVVNWQEKQEQYCFDEKMQVFTHLHSQLCTEVMQETVINCTETPHSEAFALTHHPYELQTFYKKQKIQLCPDDPTSLFDMVRRWHRTPYRWGGRTRKGVDCQGFVGAIHDSLFQNSLPAGAGSQYAVTEPVKKSALQAGDLIFFKIGGYHISHVGIYLKDNKFAHASSGFGVIISDLNEAYYKRWYFAAGRVIPSALAPIAKQHISKKSTSPTNNSNSTENPLKPQTGSIRIKYIN